MDASKAKHQAPHIRITLTTVNGRTGVFWLHNEEQTEIAWDDDGDDETDEALFEVMSADLQTVESRVVVSGDDWMAIEDSGELAYVAIWCRRGCSLETSIQAAIYAEDPRGYDNEYEQALEDRDERLKVLETTLLQIHEYAQNAAKAQSGDAAQWAHVVSLSAPSA